MFNGNRVCKHAVVFIQAGRLSFKCQCEILNQQKLDNIFIIRLFNVYLSGNYCTLVQWLVLFPDLGSFCV